MNRLLICGAAGRMGREIAALCQNYHFVPAAGIDAKTEEKGDFPLFSSYALCLEQADLLMDFSHASQLPQTLRYAEANHLPLVIGTTGLNRAHERLIDAAAKHIPILQSANYSLGVHALKALCRTASSMLPDFDIEIVERHHARKADAPGGTALMLYDAVAAPHSRLICGRSAALQKRSKQEIGLHALRGGTLRGIHEAGFYGEGEHLLLTHVAEDRSIFARGALKGARWLLSQPPGRYGMDSLFAARQKTGNG